MSIQGSVAPEDLGFSRGASMVCGIGSGFRKGSGSLVGEVGYNREAGRGWAWRVYEVRASGRFREEVRLLREGVGTRDACLLACEEALRALSGGSDVPALANWRRLTAGWERRLGLMALWVLLTPFLVMAGLFLYGLSKGLAAAVVDGNLGEAAKVLIWAAVCTWLGIEVHRRGPSCGGC